MKPLDKEQQAQVQHVVINGLTPVRNYLELMRMNATAEEKENYIARALVDMDTLIERIRKEFGESEPLEKSSNFFDDSGD